MNEHTQYAIEVTQLHKSFSSGSETLHVLNDLELSLSYGQSAVIMGKSGSGKSTLLHILGALEKADSGMILVDGKRLDGLSERQRERFRRESVGFIFQSHYLIEDFTLLENIMLPALLSGRDRRRTREYALELIERVGLYERKDHVPGTISGGERQRAAVARALICEPAVILADEPTGNLDEYNSSVIEELLFEILDRYQRSLILVTHDPSLKSRGTVSYELSHGVLSRW